MSEYHASYNGNGRQVTPLSTAENSYEDLVQRLMTTSDSQNRGAATNRGTVQQIDKYEEIVRRKMQEPAKAPSPQSQPAKDPSPQSQPAKDAAKVAPQRQSTRVEFADSADTDDHSQSEGQSRVFQPQKTAPRRSSPPPEQDHADNDAPPSTAAKRPVKKAKKQPRGFRSQKSARGEQDENPRPVFLRHPDHATQSERKNMYGPFYVAWPKNKKMPKEYAELAEVYGRRFQ